MALVDTLVVFIVSLLIGGFGIYAGGRFLTGVDSFEHAVFTAAIGALVWTVVSFVFGWIPLLGPVLTFLAYLWVIERRYPGGWVTAAGIALVAWLVVIVVLWVLATVGVTSFEAAGVPGA
ncbi:MAG: hypothetical protein ABEJ06_04560 [Haloarculaceae archaeon]